MINSRNLIYTNILDLTYWGGHLWSPSYYTSTLGNMSKEVVEKYINDQKYTETNKKPHKGAQ